jgi:hypothetical protein
MSHSIHRKAMHHGLNREVFKLPEVIRIVLLIHADDSAGTGGVNAAEPRIEFDDVGALGERQVCYRTVRIQGEHGQGPTAAAEQECPVMLRVHCHPMVALAPLYWIPAGHGIRGGVNFRDLVYASEIDVHFSGDPNRTAAFRFRCRISAF